LSKRQDAIFFLPSKYTKRSLKVERRSDGFVDFPDFPNSSALEN
jgi:hypothetical protein